MGSSFSHRVPPAAIPNVFFFLQRLSHGRRQYNLGQEAGSPNKVYVFVRRTRVQGERARANARHGSLLACFCQAGKVVGICRTASLIWLGKIDRNHPSPCQNGSGFTHRFVFAPKRVDSAVSKIAGCRKFEFEK